MLLLDVLYGEKDTVKALGAKWNPEIKRWYVKNRSDYYKFLKWILNKNNNREIEFLCDYIYIVESKQTCYKCRQETPVICFGVEHSFCLDYESYYDEDNNLLEDIETGAVEFGNEIHIMPAFSPIPESLLKYLEQHFHYHMGYSNFRGCSYLANHCHHCGKLQGNHFLFDEPESPFYIDSAKAAGKLKLYKISLPYDLPVYAEITFGSEDMYIKKCAPIYHLDINTNKVELESEPVFSLDEILNLSSGTYFSIK
ncbi:MAG: DUF5710 domain-containing protein [Selenomonadaceae bacterium]